MKKEVNPAELDFLLRFPVTPNVTSPMDFIANAGWGAIKVRDSEDHVPSILRSLIFGLFGGVD